MDSDLNNPHIGSSFDDFMRETLGDKDFEAMTDRVRRRVEAWAGGHADKAQRRADLVTLSGHALAGMLANPAYENWSLELSASNAVLVAEATLALIEERVK